MRNLSNDNSISFKFITSWSTKKSNLTFSIFDLLGNFISASVTDPLKVYLMFSGLFLSNVISEINFTFPFLICYKIKFLAKLKSYSLIKSVNLSILISFEIIDISEIGFLLFK